MVHGVVRASGRKADFSKSPAVSVVESTAVEGRSGRGMCSKVWNRATVFSPDVAHLQECGLFLPVL